MKKEVRCLGKRGQPKAYTPRTLRKAVDRYFASISRVVEVKEPIPTGQLDKYGHPIVEYVPVENSLGEKVFTTEYLIKPSRAGLARFLGIHRSTWDNYRDQPETYPEFQEIVEDAEDKIFAWTHEQLLSRSGRDVKGIVVELEHSWGYKQDRREEASAGAKLEDFL
ncbi:MAG: hypothetical protein IJA47_03520 [Oscillospiraceae bacterium]|nr:hypothetical protein [Oscillospiraceae bacterium]